MSECSFIVGFVFGAIPWYIGAFILLCVRTDRREKAGLVACTIAVSLSDKKKLQLFV